MRTHTIKGTGVAELGQALEEACTGWQPTVSLVFAGMGHDYMALGQLFAQRGIAMLGCTSWGEIIGNEFTESGLVAMLLDMPTAWFAMQHWEVSGNIAEVGDTLGQWAISTFANPVLVVLASGLQNDGDSLVAHMKANGRGHLRAYGGMAADDLEAQETFTFSPDWVSGSGVVAWAMDGDRIEAGGVVSCGWKPVGSEKRVTKADGNILYEIDGEPAFDAFVRYFSLKTDIHDNTKVIKEMGFHHPLQVYREGGYTVQRAPMTANPEDHSIKLAGGLKEGDRIRFSVQNGMDVLNEAISNAERLRQELMAQADAVMLFSCAARRMAFGPMIKRELEGIHGQWAQTPMVGFFSYGEIGNQYGRPCDFHNETCSLLVLRENRPAQAY